MLVISGETVVGQDSKQKDAEDFGKHDPNTFVVSRASFILAVGTNAVLGSILNDFVG